MRNADVMLRTTLFDGDAISVHEALYLGTRVIATDNGMRPGGVRLIPNADRNALVRKILAVASGNKRKHEPSASVNTNILEVIEFTRTSTGRPKDHLALSP
jgi:glycosyltransferase involved in cell wall biosynthesis